MNKIMYITLTFILHLIISTTQACQTIDQESCSAESDCLAHENVGLATQCIGSQFEAGKVSMLQFQNTLQVILSRTPSTSKMYVMGLISEPNIKLVAGSVTHYNFETVKSINLNPLAIKNPPTYYAPTFKSDRPILIVSDSTFQILELSDTPMPYDTVSGSYELRTVYQLPEHQKIQFTENDPCANVEKWTPRLALTQFRRVAIVIPSVLHCPASLHVNFDVVTGSFALESRVVGDNTMKVIEGIVDTHYRSDF